jgi:hypothetical protein
MIVPALVLVLVLVLRIHGWFMRCNRQLSAAADAHSRILNLLFMRIRT